MLKRNISIFMLAFVVVLFSACGKDENINENINENKVSISLAGVDCVNTPTITEIDGYETLLSGDTIVKDDVNATVTIYYNQNGTKKVCLVPNGSSAHILR